jgi:hypothetical protein
MRQGDDGVTIDQIVDLKPIFVDLGGFASADDDGSAGRTGNDQ